MKKFLLSTVMASLLLSACAGRDANPVQVVQLKDATMDCTAITAELAGDTARQTQLSKEKGDKTTQNVVVGVVGAVLFWPALFAMDFKGAADTDSKALESRDAYLSTLAAQRCAAPKTVATLGYSAAQPAR